MPSSLPSTVMLPIRLGRGFRSSRLSFHLQPKSYTRQWPRTRTLTSSAHFDNRYRHWTSTNSWILYPTCAVILGAACFVTYQTSQPFRHTTLAIVRCSRVAGAAIISALDYKITMLKAFDSLEEETNAYSECHTRSARRVLAALLANGGVFIKMGQHMASLVVLPVEWTTTMKVLQDKCEPTRYEDLELLFLEEMGVPIAALFDEFDPTPIGVASLAQVHIGHHKSSGKPVAVKLQHPHLAEFCNIDMEMVDATLGWIKYWFPEFEFSWLGDEMRTNLPKEMDFVHEAHNAVRTTADFVHLRTSLYIPKVVFASKRVLIMEYIQGGRVDDLNYLNGCNINRNKVAIELSRIFSQMVFINGWFHADPHPGNLLIRSSPPNSKSPYNFEIVLLDHGLYFDLDPQLRVNYSKLWLSLMAPASPSTLRDRRKYAELVGNIGPELYPVFEAAITGRVALEGSWDEMEDSTFRRVSSVIEMAPQSDEEKNVIRKVVLEKEGLLLSVFDVLRRIPRRVLMVLKLNDLTRSLDHALLTTHSSIRIFLVSAKYCTRAVWQDDRRRLLDEMRAQGLLSIKLLSEYFRCWWKFQEAYSKLSLLEFGMDFHAYMIVSKERVAGLWTKSAQDLRTTVNQVMVE